MNLYRETMEERLLLGLPAKGRIGADTRQFLKDAGIPILGQEQRSYFGLLLLKDCPEVRIAFLSATEIVLALERGDLHVGISGKDLIHENIETPKDSLGLVENLGFSRADLRVAVPCSWIDVKTMDDLNDVTRDFHAKHGRLLRVATKYPRLTREIFRRGDIDMYRIVASLGATEGAPRAGLAEAVVDISSSGATLKSNGLKPLEDVCWPSQAQLAISMNAPWNQTTRGIAKQLLGMVSTHFGASGANSKRSGPRRLPSDQCKDTN